MSRLLCICISVHRIYIASDDDEEKCVTEMCAEKNQKTNNKKVHLFIFSFDEQMIRCQLIMIENRDRDTERKRGKSHGDPSFYK